MENDTAGYWRIAGILRMCGENGEAIANMSEPNIKEIRKRNQQLHTLLVSLSATLLRKFAAGYEIDRPFDRTDAERFVHEAEQCFRCAKMPGLRHEIAEALMVAGHHLMATAVEIETELDRLKQNS